MSKTYIFLGGPPASAVQDKREAWMPKGDVPYFDKVARKRFESRKEKRAWLKANGMRECGELINPNKHVKGREKSSRTPQREVAAQWLRQQGGTERLLERIQAGRGHFL